MSTESHKPTPDDQDTFNDTPDAPATADANAEGTGAESASSAGGNGVAELKDKYLRLMAEFENYKRRTTKERIELFKTANQELMVALLPVLDDFERARQHTRDVTDPQAVRDGLNIVYDKLNRTLQQKGLKPMDAVGTPFDSELHEAITQIPAPSDDQKGRVIDEVERGYYLNDKVLRHAKVVLGS